MTTDQSAQTGAFPLTGPLPLTGVEETPPGYPAHWEADVLLLDGRSARIRPTRPGDTPALVEFYAGVSDTSKYLRYFAPHPELSQAELDRLTTSDYDRDVGLVVESGGRILALGTYGRTRLAGEAEMAFLVADAHHGRGIGAILLEHLAQAARERGVAKFVAEILPSNGDMIGTLRAAGYQMRMSREDGFFWFECELAPTDHALGVMLDREQRAEVVSMQRCLQPASVAVIGASQQPGTIGRMLLRHLIDGDFAGRVYAVNPNAPAVLGMPTYAGVLDIPHPVDLAVVAVRAELVSKVVRDCAAKGVHALVVVSSGFAEADDAGRAAQRRLLKRVRKAGMRMIGPNCLGIINTRADLRLNASLSAVMPAPGRVGFFCQTGALGVTILQALDRRGIGLSTFVSAGNRADVSGNDLLHYWDEDPDTDVVLLYLESLGNPRKFSRIARQVTRTKPVVAVRSGRRSRHEHRDQPYGQGVGGGPGGEAPEGTITRAPQEVVDTMFRQAGIIQVDTMDAMFDVAQLLAHQPLPVGNRVAIVGDSHGLEILAGEACWTAGLEVVDVASLGATAGADDYATALTRLVADERVDAIVALYASVVPTDVDAVAGALRAATGPKPLVATFQGLEGVPPILRREPGDTPPGFGSIPSYRTPEGAVRALASAVRYSAWLARPEPTLRVFGDVAEDEARELIAGILAEHPEGVELDDEQTQRLLACYGIRLLTSRPVATLDEAVAAGDELGWNVALRVTEPSLRRRLDLVHARRHLDGPQDMRQAWAELSAHIDDMPGARPVVQVMSPPGVPTQITCLEDDGFGPGIAFSVATRGSDLLGDVAYGIPPLTEADVSELVRGVKASRLLFNHRGSGWADVAALENVVHRVSQLKDALPDVQYLQLGRVLVGTRGVGVVWATVRVRPNTASRSDWYTRRLTGTEDGVADIQLP